MEQITLAGGCFWCTEAVFKRLKGVLKTTPGYVKGAESVQIEFNPNIISFEHLLDIFWTVHDPTTLNRQGVDIGTQYRSAIFYHNQKQKEISERSKERMGKDVVTEITPLDKFLKAETYHQNYYDRNKGLNPYCSLVIDPKIEKLLEKFNSGVKKEYLLTPEQYNICFLKGTEPPFSGKYTNNHEPGIYSCVVCQTPLFSSDSKFDSKTGWPSFDKPIANPNITYADDYSMGVKKIEVMCKVCGSHLGHVFDDGPTKTGKRFCINSLSLNFIPKNNTQPGF